MKFGTSISKFMLSPISNSGVISASSLSEPVVIPSSFRSLGSIISIKELVRKMSGLVSDNELRSTNRILGWLFVSSGTRIPVALRTVPVFVLVLIRRRPRCGSVPSMNIRISLLIS